MQRIAEATGPARKGGDAIQPLLVNEPTDQVDSRDRHLEQPPETGIGPRRKPNALAHRFVIAGGIAATCALLDLLVKVAARTPPWAFHDVPARWWVASFAVLLGLLPVLWIPSTAAAAAVGVLGGGVIGNLAANAAYGSVPNPLVASAYGYGLAFNVADVFIGAGFVALSITLVLRVRRGESPSAKSGLSGI